MPSPTLRHAPQPSPLLLGTFLCLLLGAAPWSARAQDPTPTPVPARVGSDAPHQERNPTQRAASTYQIRRFGGATPPAATATAAANTEAAPKVAARKPSRKVRVKKAIPMGPTPEELAAERLEWQRRPMRVGNDAPHYERNGSAEARATRLISLERP